MDLTELENLVKESEGQHLEYKETTGQRVEACRTLCAFLNKDGGTVVFGVTRKGKPTGQLMADTTKRDLYDAFQAFEPAADVEVEYVPVDQTDAAIVCRVDKGNCCPYVYDGKPYKRVQSSTTVMGQEEYEGKPERIDYPQLEVKMGWFKGADQRLFLDNLHRQGNVFKLMDEAMAFCFKHLNLSAKITGKIAHVLYLRKSIETWGRGFTRVADECHRVGLPLPTVKVEHGCVITTFKRPDWTRSDASCQITGTPCQITGARWTITDVNPFARLPKMRKDARENAEAVLHEIIADNGVTLAQICARTGMALRTINNALLTLREAGIINSPVVNRVVNDGANGAKDGANGANDGVSHSDEGSATADSVIRLLRQDPRMSAIRMATALGIGRRTAQRALKSLRLSGKIRRRGGTRGYWEVMA